MAPQRRRFARSAPAPDGGDLLLGDEPPPGAARTLAQQQLLAATRLTHIGRFHADLAGGRIVVDAACRTILGWGAGERGAAELLSLLLARVHPDDLEQARRTIRAAAGAGGDFEIHGRVQVTDAHRGTEQERWLAAAGSASRDANGALSVVGVVVDRTEERLREERWLRGQKREALGGLAAGIAHDLNNVMAAIVGNVALAQMELEEGRQPTQSVREIEQASRRAGEMLRRLLKFGRDDTAEPAPFDLAQVATDACVLLGPTIGPSVALSTPAPCEDCWMVGHTDQIHQLVINLVTNAAFAVARDGRIAVEVDHPDDPGDVLRLRVIDDGPGIADEVLPRIFDPFFTTKEPEEGTGLGLAAAAAITDLHLGSIAVVTEVGAGSTFSVELPVGDLDAASASEHELPVAGARHGKVRVAIVAPDADQRHQAQVSMPSFGCIPVLFADAEQALAALADDPTGFDALVCDASAHARPRELIRAARSTRADLPVVIHAGADATLSRAEAQALGVDAWVPRPCPPSELCAAILRLI